jgi:hypothetical protein
MRAVGNYRLVLHPEADPAALEAALAGDGSTPFGLVQATRVTSGISARLLRGVGAGPDWRPTRQYVWEVTLQLMTAEPRYAFADNLQRLQSAVAEYATVLEVEAYAEIPPVAPDPGGEPVES